MLSERGLSEPLSQRPEEPGSDVDAALGSRSPTPDELSSKHLRRRLLEFTALTVAVGFVLLTGPGLGNVRRDVEHASVGWLISGVGLEALSALSYVVIFRAVFCPRMPWRLAYQVGMSEQGANSVLSVSGAGGLALGAWVLRRGGMSAEQIGRKSVAFFFLTSLANVAGVIVFAALYAAGVLGHVRDPALTYGFGAAALVATVLVLALPRLLETTATAEPAAPAKPGRIARAMRFARYSLGQGIGDARLLLRHRSPGVLIGSVGTMVFDMAVLGVCFIAFGDSPPFGVLVLGYLIGQLGGNLPTPGGIGGVDLGLVGMFTLYHQPLAVSTAAVLTYHAISLWIPGLLGSLAFVQLRRTLRREPRPHVVCTPLGEPIAAAPSS
jgi:uncharacterized membrane protein YbhN (UPF0104 family)